jgi:hypothetical protein
VTKCVVLLLVRFEFGAGTDNGECKLTTPSPTKPDDGFAERPLSIRKEANLLHGQKIYIPQSSVMKRVGIFTNGRVRPVKPTFPQNSLVVSVL